MAIYSHLHPRHKKPTRTKWRSTKVMKVQDLARDDDFLSHLLVEKLGTGHIPLLVHKMDPSRRLPKTSPQDLMAIIRRVRFIFPSPLPLVSLLPSITLINAFSSPRQLVSVKGSPVTAIHDAVDCLLEFVFSCHSLSFPSQISRVKFQAALRSLFYQRFHRARDKLVCYVRLSFIVLCAPPR